MNGLSNTVVLSAEDTVFNSETTNVDHHLQDFLAGKENCNAIFCHSQKKLKQTSEEDRLRTNEKERHRMHQLNKAMDDLKRVLPYSKSVNRISKMSTLLLARNHIVSLQKTQRGLQQLVHQLTRRNHDNIVRKIPQQYNPFPIFRDNQQCIAPVEQTQNRKLMDITNARRAGGNKTKVEKFSIDYLLS